MALTTNLGLLKPDRHDFVSVQTDINGNMEIIDTKTIRTPVTINGLENSDPVNPANVTVSVTGDFTGMVLLGYDIGDKHAFNTLSVVLTAGAMEVQSQIKAASSSTLVLYMGYQVGGRATNQTYVLDIDSAQWTAIDANTTKIGNTAMGTVATTLTGAIKEQGDLIKAGDKKMAIVVSGNTSMDNIADGNYVIVENSIIPTINDGLYVAANNVTAGTALVAADLSDSNTGLGGLNALNSKIGTKFKYTSVSVAVGTGITPIGGCAWRSDYKSIGAGKKIVSVIPRAYTGGLFIPVVRYDSRDQFCLFGTYSENITCDVIYADSADIT